MKSDTVLSHQSDPPRHSDDVRYGTSPGPGPETESRPAPTPTTPATTGPSASAPTKTTPALSGTKYGTATGKRTAGTEVQLAPTTTTTCTNVAPAENWFVLSTLCIEGG
ncbi:hypothetical protein Pelo_1635 [Pelomyxa schiedti]|nr:hypothetical protein Pelo_1635 [Pelomyxa schiedti]